MDLFLLLDLSLVDAARILAASEGRWVVIDARVERTREAVLAAARRVLLKEGWDSVTHLTIASASGVGRATVYRHWPTRADLLRDVIRREAEMGHTVPTGDLRRDLRRELERLGQHLGDPAVTTVMAVLFERSLHDPMLAAVKQVVMDEVSRVVREILQRGVQSGELVQGLDLDGAAACLLGPLLYRRLATDRLVTRRVVRGVVGNFLAAAGTVLEPQR